MANKILYNLTLTKLHPVRLGLLRFVRLFLYKHAYEQKPQSARCTCLYFSEIPRDTTKRFWDEGAKKSGATNLCPI